MADPKESFIDEPWAGKEEKKLQDIQLNYWTSLCGDKLWDRELKDWKTRLRITASVQLDQRLAYAAPPASVTGSPFYHSQIYDFSEKYGLARRTLSSTFLTSFLNAYEIDSSSTLTTHLKALRDVNEDVSIAGQFTLERLWLRDGAGVPAFAVGDYIERITGRDYNLSVSFGGGVVYPEIIQIVYLPDKQKMKLITRDLRFAEVTL